MSQPEALARAQRLRGAILDQGVRACSIELVEGRAGSGWSDDRFVATMGHHIVSHRGQGLTPGLNLVKVGRADLPGPLCNGYGGFDEVARIICMGWANHPGAGGPYEVPSGVIPENNGRPYLFGWEFEGGINISDFTDSYRMFMARCLAGTLVWLRLEEASHIEHKTWAPGRKVDRLGYTLTQARSEIAAELDNPPPEEDDEMTPAQEAKLDQLITMVGALPAATWKHPQKDDPTVTSSFQYLIRTYAAVAGDDVDEAQIASLILAELTPETIVAALPDDLAAAVADELAVRLTG